MSAAAEIDESSLRYPGWRAVLAAFLVAMFIFGFGLYGHAVYLAELQRLHGWSTGLISTASTLSFLLGSLLAIFTTDAMTRIGAGRLVLCGVFALAASMMWLAFAEAPWELYAAYLLLACAWMGMGTVVIATLVSSWFDRRRGLALSIAFNGATCGGIVVAPTLVVLVDRMGFTRAMLSMTAVMLIVLIPAVTGLIGMSAPERPAGNNNPAAPALSRAKLLSNFAFWTITAPFALALLAQVGFIVHQIALLEPTMGRSLAGLAVAVTTAMSLTGRLCLGVVVDRLDPRRTAAVSIATQALAFCVIGWTSNTAFLFVACAVFGFSIGNLITLPPLIIHREFRAADFGVVMGLSTSICGIVNALGPGVVGLVRAATGGYAAALMLYVMLQLVAAAIVLLRPR
ncbi:MAG TPA: MFS transporter [Bradyrhizobium sp.]|nr:MFS transporter [Bradyrhizobium sp.]